MRQKGFGKKVFSLALAAAMSVSLCAPAWAEGVTGSSAGSGTTNSQQEQVDGEEGSAFDDEKQQNTDSVVEEDNAGNNVSEGEGEQNANSATDSDEEKENTADSDSTGAGAESSSDAEEQQNNYSAENELLSNEVLGIAAVNETDGESVVYVASVGEQGYTTLQDAIDKAAVNATVTLEANVALDNMLVISKAVTLDLMGKTISASDAFQKDNSASYNNHLVDIQADGVTIKNGVLEAGSNNNHTLNVWKASNVTLQNLTLDNTNTYGGAPLIVGSSNVTLAGNMNFITGENSWYSVNVDGTYNGMTLTFKENAKVALGTSPLGIQVDSSTAEKMVTLDFKSGVTVTGSSYPLVLNTQATNHPSEVMKVTGLANSNLKEPQIVGAVAKIDDVYYATLADAISNAAENATVVLLKDVKEDVVIPQGKTIVLDLNGCNLTNVANHTITNNGTLTVTGNGTVDNLTHAKGAFYNNVGATAILNGGTYTRSLENGQSSSNSGGNSWYAIKNFGTMTINEGVTVKFDGAFSSLVANGWYSYGSSSEPAPNGGTANLIINGGTFTGGLNTIKNDDGGVLGINGGTFKNVVQHAVLNVNVAIINDGTFDVTGNSTDEDLLVATVCNRAYNDSYDKGELTITGGKFSAPVGKECVVAQKVGAEPAVTVSGGYFTADPSEYLAEKFAAVASDLNGYLYMVGKAGNTPAIVVEEKPAETGNAVANNPSATEQDKELADKIYENLENLTVQEDVLQAEVKTVANNNTFTAKAGLEELKKQGVATGTVQESAVTIVVQPYLSMEVRGVETPAEGESAEGRKTFTLDITPMYRTVATTANVAGNDDIIVKGEEAGETANAVVMGKPAKLNVTKPVEMTIRLPDGFAAEDTTLYVLHQKDDGRRYQYVGTVNDENVLTFTNPNGFSVFTISTQEFDLSTNDTTDSSNTTTTPAATPAPTAAPQQSGSNITYYTCQACGYHDWTATAEGYKCNHCGYIESVKQLSGYGNVKGVYEPKTSTAAAQTGAAASGTVSSAIPQTGDEQPITALVVVAVAALLGLGVTVVMKKRNND